MQQRLASTQQQEMAGMQVNSLQGMRGGGVGDGGGGGGGGGVASGGAAGAAGTLKPGGAGDRRGAAASAVAAAAAAAAAVAAVGVGGALSGSVDGSSSSSSSSSTSTSTPPSISDQINSNGACKLPMVSFEVAVLALAVFFSPGGVGDLTEFLLLSEKFFGTFCVLAAAVSVATPGGELVGWFLASY
jgi:hypothetical protein